MQKILVLIGFFLVSSGLISAQDPPANNVPNTQQQMAREAQQQQQQQQQQEQRQQLMREQRQRQADLERLKVYESQNNADSRYVDLKRREPLPFKLPINKEQRARLAPNSHLLSKYSGLLKQERTGLIKLFPDAGCEANAYIVRADDKCLNWIPNSSSFSFREKEHTVEILSDIFYVNGHLVSNGVLSQGILTAIGDVPLEGVSLATGGMQFLVDYKPESQAQEALRQFNEISRGVKAGQFIYAKALPTLENMTYLARVIAYRGRVYKPFRGRLFDVLYGDKRVDLTLAFRIVRKDEDGSVTLLWKEVERREAPKLIRPKRQSKSGNNSNSAGE